MMSEYSLIDKIKDLLEDIQHNTELDPVTDTRVEMILEEINGEENSHKERETSEENGIQK